MKHFIVPLSCVFMIKQVTVHQNNKNKQVLDNFQAFTKYNSAVDLNVKLRSIVLCR
jgi:hypothetical protein